MAKKGLDSRTFLVITTLLSFFPVEAWVTCRSTVFLLAMPEYLNECTPIRLPGSQLNCTAPSLLVFPRLTKKLFESRIRFQIRDSDAILLQL